jgi:L-threonylcarbamoyladenylate synthase
VTPSIVEGVDEVLDGGELPGTASTVIDLSSYEEGDFRVLREGALTAEQVAATLRP